MLDSIGKALGIAGAGVSLGQQLGFYGGADGWAPSSRKEAEAPLREGIRWRVADAKAAGIHPLYALGAPSFSGLGGTVRPARNPGGALSAAGRQVSQFGRDRDARAAAQREEARRDTETASSVRVNESQAMLNEARAAQLNQEVRQMPGTTITSVPLDPSHIKDQSGRLAMWRDSNGKWHKVDRNITPQNVLEDEYGEAAEVQGIARAMKGAYSYGGSLEGLSLADLVEALRGSALPPGVTSKTGRQKGYIR